MYYTTLYYTTTNILSVLYYIHYTILYMLRLRLVSFMTSVKFSVLLSAQSHSQTNDQSE